MRREAKTAPKRRFIQKAIKREDALTERVGGPPGENVEKVRRIAKEGTPLAKKQANLFLNVLRPAAKKRKKKSLIS